VETQDGMKKGYRYGAVQNPIACVDKKFEMEFSSISLHEEWISIQLCI